MTRLRKCAVCAVVHVGEGGVEVVSLTMRALQLPHPVPPIVTPFCATHQSHQLAGSPLLHHLISHKVCVLAECSPNNEKPLIIEPL